MKPFDKEVYVFLEKKDVKNARLWLLGNYLYVIGLGAAVLILAFVLAQILLWVFVPLALAVWLVGMAMKWWASRQAKKQGYVIIEQ